MFTKFFVIASLVCLLVINAQGRPQQQEDGSTTEAGTWDKIKKGVEHGWNVVYDESHCAFHKVKDLVKQHDHEEGSDPCVNKPYQQSTSTTQKSIVLVAEDIVPATSTQKPL